MTKIVKTCHHLCGCIINKILYSPPPNLLTKKAVLYRLCFRCIQSVILSSDSKKKDLVLDLSLRTQMQTIFESELIISTSLCTCQVVVQTFVSPKTRFWPSVSYWQENTDSWILFLGKWIGYYQYNCNQLRVLWPKKD